MSVNGKGSEHIDRAAPLLMTLVEGREGEAFLDALEAHDLAAIFDDLDLSTVATELRRDALRRLAEVACVPPGVRWFTAAHR